ncbi:hypothetical protein, partial [Escherichia coli]|uniref:hypothetical protein n=1 Tax=Escherichia coli TaxID=562 RepID=UPI001A7E0F0F
KRAYCLKTQPATGETYPKSDLFNKAQILYSAYARAQAKSDALASPSGGRTLFLELAQVSLCCQNMSQNVRGGLRYREIFYRL